MSARATSTRFVILGVDVVVDSESPEVTERLGDCYHVGAVASGSIQTAPTRASLTATTDGWTVHVDGRSPVGAPDVPAALRLLNHELLHGVMLQRREFLYVHAGVVAIGDQAIVLPGLSQAGKSTIALALLAKGARYLSDELLVYDPEGHRALAYPRAPKVRDACVDYFVSHQAHFVGEGEGRFLRLESLGHDAIAESAEPVLVAAPRWDPNGDNEPATLSEGTTLLRLVASTLNFGMRKNESVDILAALAGRVRGYDIVWSDPHIAADALLRELRT